MEKVTQTPATAAGGTRVPVGRGRSPKVKTLIAFSVLIMLLFCGFVAYQASKAYARSIEEGKTNANRLTRILADQVKLTFMGVDQVLQRGVERQYFNTMFGGNLPHDIENNFRMWVNNTPQIAALMLVNERGLIEVAANKKGYDNWYNYTESVENDPAFASMKDDAEHPAYLGQQQSNLPLHPRLIIMSQRINKLDGSFGGVIIAAIDPAFFSDFFSSIDQGSSRFMALLLEDGSTLFSGPGEDTTREPIIRFISEQVRSTRKQPEIVTDTKTFENAIKIVSFTHLKGGLPIIAAVVVDEKDFLSSWRSARMKDISFLAIFTIFGSVLSYFALTMARQIMRVEESEASAILASQAKSEFLANMSHELRTPLNAVIGFSEMLGAGYFGGLNDKQKERVQDINLCGTHLLQLISDILEFSKGEAGKLELYEEEIDVARAVQEAARIIAERAKAKQISVVTGLPEQLPLLFADKRKVRQILLNLLSNAIKFTPSGGTITIGVKLDTHRQLVLSVSDTGVGIAEADIPRALAVFGQVHRSQSHEGTGLGLPLCKMFAELHGGKLLLTSVVGEGTTVRVVFPEGRVR